MMMLIMVMMGMGMVVVMAMMVTTRTTTMAVKMMKMGDEIVKVMVGRYNMVSSISISGTIW